MGTLHNNKIYFNVSQSQKATFVGYIYRKRVAPPFNISFSININAVPINILNKVFELLIERHEVFRTSLVLIKGEVKQKVWAFDPNLFKIKVVKLINSPKKEQILSKLIHNSQQFKFRPDRIPWIHVMLAVLDKNNSKLIISMPHMISDRRSVDIIKEELVKLYKASITGESLPNNIVQYKDYIIEINKKFEGDKVERYRKFWMEVLKDLPKKSLSSVYSNYNHLRNNSYRLNLQDEIRECCISLTDKESSIIYGTMSFLKSFKGNNYYFCIELERLNALKKVARITHVSLSVIIMATVQLLIHKLIKINDVILGLNINLRDNIRYENTIGFLLNTVVLRYKIDDSLTLHHYIQAYNLHYIRTMRYKLYPFENVLKDSDIPLHRIANVFLNIKNNELFKSHVNKFDPFFKDENDYPFFDIDCHIDIYSNLIQLLIIYKVEFFKSEIIELFFSKYLTLIDIITSNLNLKVKDIKLT
jgi:hypothetical protein